MTSVEDGKAGHLPVSERNQIRMDNTSRHRFRTVVMRSVVPPILSISRMTGC
jgi:hypothetical protein